MNPIRVLLVDDHTIFRAGLRSLLEAIAGVMVVAEAGDGAQAIALAGESGPDVALVDISMPGINGLELTQRLAEAGSATRVMILSMHRDEAFVRRAIQAGACGYLLKDADPAELELAIRAVAKGEIYLSPAVSLQLVSEYRRLSVDRTEAGPLTVRQREVLRMLAEGQNTKSIARSLGISTKTVETHRGQLMERLKIHDIAGLVRYAVRSGLVDPES